MPCALYSSLLCLRHPPTGASALPVSSAHFVNISHQAASMCSLAGLAMCGEIVHGSAAVGCPATTVRHLPTNTLRPPPSLSRLHTE